MLRALEGNEICADYGADGSVILVAAAPPQATWADGDFGRVREAYGTADEPVGDTALLAAGAHGTLSCLFATQLLPRLLPVHGSADSSGEGCPDSAPPQPKRRRASAAPSARPR